MDFVQWSLMIPSIAFFGGQKDAPFLFSPMEILIGFNPLYLSAIKTLTLAAILITPPDKTNQNLLFITSPKVIEMFV